MGSEEDAILKRIEDVPNLCQVKLSSTHRGKVKGVLKRLEQEMSEDPEQEMSEDPALATEWLRRMNLKTYLHIEKSGFKDIKTARELNEEARKARPDNLVAICHHIRLLLINDIAQVKKEVDHIDQLRETDGYGQLVIEAKAELAYCYSRFGPAFHSQSLGLFREVLALAPDNYLWRFGYGLVLQRCLNPENYVESQKCDGSALFLKAVDALYEVTNCPDSSLAAQAWVKIGTCVTLYKHMTKEYKPDEQEAMTHLSELKITDAKMCYEKALKTAPDNRVVLQECGRFYRRRENQDMVLAEKYLKRAHEQQPTVFNCQHLALLHIDKWKNEMRMRRSQSFPYSPNRGARGRGRGYRRGRGGFSRNLQYESSSLRPAAVNDRPESRLKHSMSLPAGEANLESGYYSADFSEPVADLSANFSALTMDPETRMNLVSATQRPRQQFCVPVVSPARGPQTRYRLHKCERASSTTTCQYVTPISSAEQQATPQNVRSVKSSPSSGSSQEMSSADSIRRYIKSPKRLLKADDPDDPVLNKALEYLEEACGLTKETVISARNIEGQVYRHLGKNREAIDCFAEVTRCGSAGLLSKISAFEQRGYCFVELANLSSNEDERCESLDSAYSMFFLAIGNAVLLDLPFAYGCPSEETLRELLEQRSRKNPREKKTRRQLSEFHQLIGNLTIALEYLEDVLQLDPNDFESHMQKAQLLMKNDQHEKALCFMMMLLKTKFKDQVLNKKKLMLEAAVTAAKKRLDKKQIDIAKEYFKRAYQINFEVVDDSKDDDDNCAQCHVFVTGNPPESFSYFSGVVNRYFDLECYSIDNVLPGEQIPKMISNAIEKSTNFLIVSQPNSTTTDQTESTIDQSQSHFIQEVLVSVKSRKPESYSVTVAIEDRETMDPCLKHCSPNVIAPYSAWKESGESTKLVIDLFKAIINFDEEEQ